jgi:hypothetical protein
MPLEDLLRALELDHAERRVEPVVLGPCVVVRPDRVSL